VVKVNKPQIPAARQLNSTGWRLMSVGPNYRPGFLVNILVPRILRWLLDFSKICAPLHGVNYEDGLQTDGSDEPVTLTLEAVTSYQTSTHTYQTFNDKFIYLCCGDILLCCGDILYLYCICVRILYLCRYIVFVCVDCNIVGILYLGRYIVFG
jgi:hypothetical protein